MGLAEQADLVVKLSLKDELSRGVAGAKRELAGLGTTAGRIGSQVSSEAATAAKTLALVGVAAAGIAAGGLTAAVKSAADFEAQLNTINTVAQVNANQL